MLKYLTMSTQIKCEKEDESKYTLPYKTSCHQSVTSQQRH